MRRQVRPQNADDGAVQAVTRPTAGLDAVTAVATGLADNLSQVIRGKPEALRLSLVALLSGHHLLLEDVPGVGKTLLAKALARSLGGTFRRIQGTPDLLPAELTGVSVFHKDTEQWEFRPGPLFANVVLVDEINRASPKVQSALLEAMAEKQVTVDNICHKLDELFYVIATQNPLDSVGTYPLPMAQLDRFLFKIRMRHIDRESELEVLRTWGQPREREQLPRVNRGDVVTARRLLRHGVTVAPAIQECLVDIAQRLRDDRRIRQGVSTRCLVQAVPALQTLAMLRGRDYVSSADLEHLATPLFAHRLELVPGTDPVERVIAEAIGKPIETLSRATLR